MFLVHIDRVMMGNNANLPQFKWGPEKKSRVLDNKLASTICMYLRCKQVFRYTRIHGEEISYDAFLAR